MLVRFLKQVKKVLPPWSNRATIVQFLPWEERVDELLNSNPKCRLSSYRAAHGVWIPASETYHEDHDIIIGESNHVVMMDDPEGTRTFHTYGPSFSPYIHFHALESERKIDWGQNKGIGSPAHLHVGCPKQSKRGSVAFAFQGNRNLMYPPPLCLVIVPKSYRGEMITLASGNAKLRIRKPFRESQAEWQLELKDSPNNDPGTWDRLPWSEEEFVFERHNLNVHNLNP